MKKVVAYGKYNNEKKIKEFKKIINREMNKHKDWVLNKMYIDNTKKNNTNESAFIVMLNEILDENISIILVENIDKYINSIKFIKTFTKYLERLNIEIRFLKEEVTTIDIEGKIMLEIKLNMNELQKKQIHRKNIGKLEG